MSVCYDAPCNGGMQEKMRVSLLPQKISNGYPNEKTVLECLSAACLLHSKPPYNRTGIFFRRENGWLLEVQRYGA